jgi:hypothetical protein
LLAVLFRLKTLRIFDGALSKIIFSIALGWPPVPDMMSKGAR